MVSIDVFSQCKVFMNMKRSALGKGYSPVAKCVEIRITMSQTESGIKLSAITDLSPSLVNQIFTSQEDSGLLML